jgi:hypothetical protein
VETGHETPDSLPNVEPLGFGTEEDAQVEPLKTEARGVAIAPA